MKKILQRFTQWIILHFKTYTWLGTFRYNCIRGQLNNEEEGDKTEIGKEYYDKE